MLTVDGPLFPGRRNTVAKCTFFSREGDSLEATLLLRVGDSGICGPGACTAVSPLDTGTGEGPASSSHPPFPARGLPPNLLCPLLAPLPGLPAADLVLQQHLLL